MIPFLLQHRVGGGGPPPPTLINPPSYDGVSAEAGDYQTGSPASATATFTIKADGTWTAQGLPGSSSGNWLTTPGVGLGAGYEVRFTVTSSSGGGSEVNGAPTFTVVSADRAISINASRSTFGVTNRIRGALVEIRPIGGAVGASGTVTLDAYAEVG